MEGADEREVEELMAVKQLVLRMKLNGKKKELDDLRAKDAEFQTRRAALKTREDELAGSIDEATTDEDKAAVETEAAAIEADETALTTEETDHTASKQKLSNEIADLERQLKELDDKAPKPDTATPAEHEDERKADTHMKTRNKFRQSPEQRSAYLKRKDVAEFYSNLRTIISEKRAVTGTELTIPEVTLGLLRDNIDLYSKLYKHVNAVPVKGKARKKILGVIPEGVWTEVKGALNELAFGFSTVEVDGYKVGGFIPLDNSDIEDSDENLSMIVEDGIGQAIGKALDRAILFGTHIKMLLGILPRLAQTSQPSDWDDNMPTWTDLHSTNLLSLNPSSLTGEAFFAALILKLGVAKPNYSDGTLFWCMTRATYMVLLSKALTFNSAGALVASMNQTMPIIGGTVEFLDFMTDNDIVGGYGSLYLLAERSGATIAVSEHVRFLQDQTLWKGEARYDGMPVFGEGFVAVNINNGSVTTTTTWPQDAANTVATPTALPIAGNFATSTQVFLSCATPGATMYYTDDGSTPDATKTAYNGPITLTATKTIKAIAIKSGMTNSAVFSGTYTKSN